MGTGLFVSNSPVTLLTSWPTAFRRWILSSACPVNRGRRSSRWNWVQVWPRPPGKRDRCKGGRREKERTRISHSIDTGQVSGFFCVYRRMVNDQYSDRRRKRPVGCKSREQILPNCPTAQRGGGSLQRR